jgi:hypothetical protein
MPKALSCFGMEIVANQTAIALKLPGKAGKFNM